MSFCSLQQLENQQRIQRGDKPLPDEDINKLFKPLQPPPRLDSLLVTGQIDNYCSQMGDFISQSFGKLFMAESLQEKQSSSTTWWLVDCSKEDMKYFVENFKRWEEKNQLW